MKPIAERQRLVKNIHDHGFEPFVFEGEVSEGESVLQVDEKVPLGAGFHVYRMAPGAVTTPHVHRSDEHFLVLDGELMDHDGHVYRSGDLVMLEKGTKHSSSTVDGCTLAVFIAAPESSLPSEIGSTGSASFLRARTARRFDGIETHQPERGDENQHRDPDNRTVTLAEDRYPPRDTSE